ncbi:MAG TPA: response regulator transcription factor [Clostridiaceae bacterium]|nr:response regulator transcription factor [Clostridiaceae bacterium]
MYKVLVADDEPLICEGMGIIINWRDYGFDNPDIAVNGKEALEKVCAGKYDLVITDIRMPLLDGLELIKALKDKKPEIKIIILSGYSEFSYARQAIQYGVKGYLLKPITADELIRNILTVKKELDEEITRTKILVKSRDAFLYDFVTGNLTWKEINKKGIEYGLNLSFDSYAVALVEIDNFFSMLEEDLDTARTRKAEIKNIIDIFVRDRSMGYVYDEIEGITGILICGSIPTIDTQKLVSEMKALCSEIFCRTGLKVFAGIGCGTACGQSVSISRKQAFQALERALFTRKDEVACYDSAAFCKLSILGEEFDTGRLITAVEECDKELAAKEIDSIISLIVEMPVNIEIVRAFVFDIQMKLCRVIKNYGGDMRVIFNEDDFEKNIFNHKSIIEFSKWLHKKCEETITYISGFLKKDSYSIIERVKKYIDEHYHEDISLKAISKVFYMNPAYLGQLFIKSEGETFNDYLNKKRISEAKKLLRNENLRMYEIIEKVGYKTLSYFYTQFQKYEGISFSEFKNN